MSYEPPTCERCGHPALSHKIFIEVVANLDGSQDTHGFRGPCQRVDTFDRVARRLSIAWCSCSSYTPDRLPRVTALLGLDVRRVVL